MSSYQEDKQEEQFREELEMRKKLVEKGAKPKDVQGMTHEQLRKALTPEEKRP